MVFPVLTTFFAPDELSSSASTREFVFTVQLFAVLKDAAQTSSLVIPHDSPSLSIAQLLQLCAVKSPQIAPYLPFLRVAVNFEYSNSNDLVSHDAEIALLPPVSGGCATQIDDENANEILPQIALTYEKIDSFAVARSAENCLHGGAGAIVTFEGVVRDNANGKMVNFLEYFAYDAMALRVLRQVSDEVRARFDVPCAVVHRLGRLEIGDASVVIAVASPHRALAFEACSFAINRLKEIVPIWKKETARDGSYWVENPLDNVAKSC